MQMHDDTTRRRRCLPALAVALLAAGVACGGSSGGGVATLAGSEQAAGPETEPAKASDKDPEEAFLDFARCMREHGIDMPDPETGGGGDVVFKAAPGAAAKRLEGNPEQFEAADKECRPLLGDAAPARLSPEQQQEMQDSMVAFARCMRENGVDMPDPEFSEGGGFAMRIGGEDAGPKFDPMSDEFQAAQEKCSEHMPGMKGMKGGGKGGMIAVRPGASSSSGSSSGASTSVGGGK
jgi:hypothetical protein